MTAVLIVACLVTGLTAIVLRWPGREEETETETETEDDTKDH